MQEDGSGAGRHRVYGEDRILQWRGSTMYAPQEEGKYSERRHQQRHKDGVRISPLHRQMWQTYSVVLVSWKALNPYSPALENANGEKCAANCNTNDCPARHRRRSLWDQKILSAHPRRRFATIGVFLSRIARDCGSSFHELSDPSSFHFFSRQINVSPPTAEKKKDRMGGIEVNITSTAIHWCKMGVHSQCSRDELS